MIIVLICNRKGFLAGLTRRAAACAGDDRLGHPRLPHTYLARWRDSSPALRGALEMLARHRLEYALARAPAKALDLDSIRFEPNGIEGVELAPPADRRRRAGLDHDRV